MQRICKEYGKLRENYEKIVRRLCEECAKNNEKLRKSLQMLREDRKKIVTDS